MIYCKTIITFLNKVNSKLTAIRDIYDDMVFNGHANAENIPLGVENVTWSNGKYNLTTATVEFDLRMRNLEDWASYQEGSEHNKEILLRIEQEVQWYSTRKVVWNKLLWRSELHCLFAFFRHHKTQKMLFPLFKSHEDDAELKIRQQVLAIITPSTLATVMMVCFI